MKINNLKIDKCRACGNPVKEFMTFGKMPIANGFLQNREDKEYFFEMSPAFCSQCFTFQLVEQPDAKLMFHEDYAFFSRQSKFMQIHFKEYAEWVMKNYSQGEDDFVIELGSNDGIMLENFAKKNIKHLGVEPSKNVALVARDHGVNTEIKFFGHETSNEILQKYGQASAILAANVMCHIPDLNDIAKGAYNLLNDKGVLIFEDPYLGDMLEKVSYDQIYDEHVYIFSAISVQKIFGRHGFELINLMRQETHGGSMRYVFAKKGMRPIESIVENIVKNEFKNQYDKESTYLKFKENCELSKRRFKEILTDAKSKNKSVAGYGATSKSTTILNYCDVGPELIDFISDTTPIKQNTFSPGKHIPVLSYEYFKNNIPDVIVLFAWNHANEIIIKEKDEIDKDIEWVTHLPFFELNI